MFIAIIPNRGSPPAVLLRESWREGKKTKKRTVGNVAGLPAEQIELIRRVLRGERLLSTQDALQIERSRPHGHVAAVLGTARKLGLEELLATRPSRERGLALAIILARLPGAALEAGDGALVRSAHGRGHPGRGAGRALSANIR